MSLINVWHAAPRPCVSSRLVRIRADFVALLADAIDIAVRHAESFAALQEAIA